MDRWRYILSAAVSASGFCLSLTLFVCNVAFLGRLPPSSYLIVWLSLFDSGVAGNQFIYALIQLTNGNVSELHCRFLGFVEFASGITTLTLCMGLTLFRYLVIVHKHNISSRFAPRYVAATITTSCLVASLPFILQHPEVYILHPTRLECNPNWAGRDASNLAVTGIAIIISATPIIFVGIAYTSIYFEVVRVNKDMQEISDHPRENASLQESSFLHIDSGRDSARLSRASVGLSVSIANTTKDTNRAQMQRDLERQHTLLVQSIVLVSLLVAGWGPYLMIGVYEFATGEFVSMDWGFAALICIALNETLNPIAVVWFDADIRNNVKRVFRVG
ncbi:hypothetical protein BC830DRAFT_1129086 [Chytriomyces sp. MP71]|nr:hypothetical protein BC830DRAFT_1129086 [Chytriomyces sp. MP71]